MCENLPSFHTMQASVSLTLCSNPDNIGAPSHHDERFFHRSREGKVYIAAWLVPTQMLQPFNSMTKVKSLDSKRHAG